MSEKRKSHIQKIGEIFPQTSTEDIEELLGQYNNDVNQVITKLTQRSEDYSWTEVKKKKPQKSIEQKQPRKQGKPRTDRRNQNANYNATTKPQTTTELETEKSRQPETSGQDQQTHQYEGNNRPPYGRGRGRGGYRQGEGYGRGGGYSQAPNGAPRYPPNQRYPNSSFRGDRPHGHPAPFHQPTPNHQPEVLNSDESSPVTLTEEPPKVSDTSDDLYQTDNEPAVSPQDQNNASLEALHLQSPQFNETESTPSSLTNPPDRESHSPVPSESKTSKTSPGQNPTANHPRVAPKASVQRWKVKESPSPTNAPSTQSLQTQEENNLPPAPQHSQTPTESDLPEEQIYVQHPPQSPQTQPSSTTTPAQAQPQPPQPSHADPLESESLIGGSTPNSQPQISTQAHEQSQQSLSQPSTQQNAPQASTSAPHSVGSGPLQQPSASQQPTSPQTPLQPNPSARNSKVVILPTGLRNEEQVSFKFGNIPLMYGESKPDEHGLSLGDMSYKPGPQHRDVHNLEYHTPEPELQEPIAQVPPYGYVPYVFPYMEESQDLQRLRMGLPQPYYEPYGFRQTIDPKPYPNRGSPITGSGYNSRDKYHPDSNPTQTNQSSNSLSQQTQAQSPQSPQIPQQQSQQAQQPPPILPQYYNSPHLYGYSYFPGQYTYQGMATTPYPYMRNIGYYKTPGTYPNYGSSAYGPPGTPLSYDEDYKYLGYPSFFAPESLAGAPIPSSKTSAVGTGSPAPGPNPQHLGGAGHVPKGQPGYSSPNSTGSQPNPLSTDKSTSEFKSYSPSGRDTSSFYHQIPGQMQYYPPNTYPPRMVQHHQQHHQHQHLHQQQTLQPSGQSTQQSQGQQPGTTQGPQQPTGQQGQARAQASQTQTQ